MYTHLSTDISIVFFLALSLSLYTCSLHICTVIITKDLPIDTHMAKGSIPNIGSEVSTAVPQVPSEGWVEVLLGASKVCEWTFRLVVLKE